MMKPVLTKNKVERDHNSMFTNKKIWNVLFWHKNIYSRKIKITHKKNVLLETLQSQTNLNMMIQNIYEMAQNKWLSTYLYHYANTISVLKASEKLILIA